MQEIFIPAMGMAMEDALLLEWLKQPGDDVAEGEVVAVIETDKSTMEVEAGGSGRLGAHLHAAGERVAVGAAIARLLGAGEQEDAASTPAQAATAPATTAPATTAGSPTTGTPSAGAPANGVGRTEIGRAHV